MIMLGATRLQDVRAGNVGIGRAYIGERLVWQTGIPVVWNQLWDNTGDNLSKSNRVTTRTEGDVLIVTKSAATSSNVAVGIQLTPGHVYYIIGDLYQNYMDSNPYTLVTAKDVSGGRYGTVNIQCPRGVWTSVDEIHEIGSSGPWLSARMATTAAVGAEIKLRNVAVIDLTLMFGPGNEPTIADPVIEKIKAYAQEHPEYNSGTDIEI